LVEKEERSELKKIVADIEASELVEEEVVTWVDFIKSFQPF
jgi:hypothetical protein